MSILVPDSSFQKVNVKLPGASEGLGVQAPDLRTVQTEGKGLGTSSLIPAIGVNHARDFTSCDLRIRTLSTILSNMHQADLATSKREDVPAFLRHLAILLTRGTDDDKEAKHVIAVTGIISESTCSVKSLVVAQNSPNARRVNSSERFHLGIKSVKGKSQPVDEIYKRIGNSSENLCEYIENMFGLFRSVDPENGVDVLKFRTFVTLRCLNKLHSRLKAGKIQWDTLESWKPTAGDEIEPFWVAKPKWTLFFDIEQNSMKTRLDGESEVWEFSKETAHLWSSILVSLLKNINNRLHDYKNTSVIHRQRPLENKNTLDLIEKIISLYSALIPFMTKYKRVVKTLLAIPSLTSSFIPAKYMPVINEDPSHKDSDKDEGAIVLLALATGESPEDGVYRRLEGIVAWGISLDQLLSSPLRKTFATTSVGVITVKGFRSNVMSVNDIISGLRTRYPDSDNFIQATKQYLVSKVPSYFYGTIHAEATIMALISHFSESTASGDHTIHDREFVSISNLEIFKKYFQPKPVSRATGVGKKCCWCCENLSQLINPAVLIPGSHGTIYPWCPPQFGISIDVLKVLEDRLWARLHQGLKDKHRNTAQTSLSRQSSGSSSIGENIIPNTIELTKHYRINSSSETWVL